MDSNNSVSEAETVAKMRLQSYKKILDDKARELGEVRGELQICKIKLLDLEEVNQKLFAEKLAANRLKDQLDVQGAKEQRILELEHNVKRLNTKLDTYEIIQTELKKINKSLQEDIDHLNQLKSEEMQYYSDVTVEVQMLRSANRRLEMDNEDLKCNMISQKNQNLCNIVETHAAAKINHLNTTIEMKNEIISEQQERIMQLESENRQLLLNIVELKKTHFQEIKAKSKKIDKLKYKFYTLKETTDEIHSNYQKQKEEYMENTLATIKTIREQAREQERAIEKLEGNLQNIKNIMKTNGEERDCLVHFADLVMKENKNLLHQLRDNQKQYLEQERESVKKLQTLKRDKERMEEKIMSMYKQTKNAKKPESPKRSSFISALRRRSLDSSMFRKLSSLSSRSSSSSKQSHEKADDFTYKKGCDLKSVEDSPPRVEENNGYGLTYNAKVRKSLGKRLSDSLPFKLGDDGETCEVSSTSSSSRDSFVGAQKIFEDDFWSCPSLEFRSCYLDGIKEVDLSDFEGEVDNDDKVAEQMTGEILTAGQEEPALPKKKFLTFKLKKALKRRAI